MNEADQDKKNRELIEALRQTFEPSMKRLRPEVEPAVVFVLNDDTRDR